MTRRSGSRVNRHPVAVIGYSLRLPGAPDRAAFWQLLSEGRCAVTQVQADRFPREAFYHPRAGAEVPGRSYTFAAGVLDDVWGFDPAAFGISPREAAQVDPQQRHLLEVTYEAIEHAALKPSQLAGSDTGVYVGASSSDYATRFMFDPGTVDVHMMTGNTLSLVSNRISYVFDLRGPSFTVDTACSSSLFALHLAMEAIGEGKIDTAIVGGVNLLLSPFSFLGFSRASMLSPSGLCRAFDASGDGYVRAEGALALVLRAEDVARRNGDRVHAVLVGSGVNQDGRTNGLSLPSPQAQARLLADVYERAGVEPDQLAFMEAHGTGTRVGDPAEADALGKVLGQKRSAPLLIGSVKTNIGHLEPASGLAGVVKSIQALEHDLLPASLHFNEPNPDIRFDELNIEVAAKAQPLAKSRGARYAGVNSFGFGGANAHVLLREPRRKNMAKDSGRIAAPLILSAHGADALKSLAECYAAAIPLQGGGAAFANAAAHTRDLLSERMVVTGTDPGIMLDDHLAGNNPPSVYRGAALGADLDIAFAFSGNGAQWVGMGLSAYLSDADFHAALDRFDTRFQPLSGWSAVQALHSPDLGADIRKASRAQPLLFAIQSSLVEALAARGVSPSLAIGHSVGEIAAAWCAGALDTEDAIRVVLARSHRQEATRHRGGMAVANVSADAVRALLDHDTFHGLEIAAVNSARSVTVAGPDAVIETFIAFAEQERWGARRLDLDYPFHCALVDRIENDLLHDLAVLRPGPTRIPMISTVTGQEIAGEALDARYWWRNVRRPVSFLEAMQTVCERGVRVLVEIGPCQVLGAYLHDALRRQSLKGAVIPTLLREVDKSTDEIGATAARILVAGGRVDLDRYIGPAARPAAILPNYAWQRRQIAFPATGEGSNAYAALPHPFLGSPFRTGSGEWFATVDPGLFPWLDDHKVEEATVFPAAAFAEIALAATRETVGDGALEVRDFEIGQPLVFDGVRSFEITTRVSHESRMFEIRSHARDGDEDWLVNVQGSVSQAPVPEAKAFVPGGKPRDVFDTEALYKLALRRGFLYGPAFRRVVSVEVFDHRTARSFLNARAPDSDRFVIDPTSLDAAFHTLFALTEADHGLPDTALLLPVRVGALRVYHPGRPVAQVTVRVTAATSRSRVADFDLLDADGGLVASLSQARCRVVSRTARDASDSLAYRTRFVQIHRSGQPSALSEICDPAQSMAEAERALPDMTEARDVSLILQAGALTAAYEAVHALADEARTVSIATLAGNGGMEMSAWPLMSRLLLALADAGLATMREENWELKDAPDLTRVPELVSLLAGRYPAYIAEATCLARMPELLPRLLQDGLEADLGYGKAVLEHLDYGSPFAWRLAAIAANAADAILAQWPQDKPIRVLVIGAGNLPVAEGIAARIETLRGSVVVTDPDSQEIVRARLHAASGGITVRDWDGAIDPAEGGYDLVLGVRSLNAVAAAAGRFELLIRTLRKGGALIAVEPSGSLFADLVYGTSPGWWTHSVNPDFPIGAILSDDDWRRLLEDAQLQENTVRPFDRDGVNGLLISAVAKDGAESRPADAESNLRSVLIVADMSAGGRTAADLLCSRLEGSSKVVPLHAAGPRRVRIVNLRDAGLLEAGIAESKPTDVVFVAAARAPAARPAAALSRQALAVVEVARHLQKHEGARLWIVCRGAVSGIADDEIPNPAQTGLWAMARVLQNEFPELDIRCLDVDPQLAMDVAASRIAETVAQPGVEKELRLNAFGQAALRVQRGGVFTALDAAGGDDAVIRLEVGQIGLLDSLAWRRVGRPELKPQDIEIEVAAAGLNFRDVMWSLGLLPEEALENGFTGPTIGMECAGVVVATGSGVTAFKPGDRVVAFAANAFASHVTVGARMAAKIPDDVPFESAATLPVAFLTAYYALVRLAQLRGGETVLIHGGAGGVGLAALQIAKLRGAIVIVTAGNADRRALLRSLGADHVLDSRSLAFVDEVRAITQDAGVDVVLNSLAGEAMIRSIDCLKPFGRFLELGKRDFYMNRHIGLRPFRNNLSYYGIDADQLLVAHEFAIEEMFAELMAMIRTGELSPLPYRVFGPQDAAAAFRLMQQSGHIGKIVIRPPKALAKPKPATAFTVAPRGRYLIVGGLGGFGLATAQWLVGKGARHLVLMGRSAENPDAAATQAIEALRAGGARVDLAAIDVADREALERYLLLLSGSDIPLKGVFHAAMVLDDGLARDLGRDRIETVLRAKVDGAANLDRLTRRFDLDCFVLFSSVSVLVGNIGQASYVAANAFMEGLARRRRVEGLPALAVQWGAIQDVGYLARNAATGKALSQRLGRAALSAAEALQALDGLLGRDPHDVGEAVIGFGRLEWSLVRKELAIARTPLFRDLHLDDAVGEGASLAAEELLRQLRELPDAEVEARLSDIIVENIARTLRLPGSDLDRARPLSDIGMDSLMMLELRMAVEEQMGIEIPLMSLTSSLTVVDVSKRLAAMLRNQDKALMSSQMSALSQVHIEVPETASDAEIAATAAAVSRRAKSVDSIL